ncbi:hypothetical protein PpBr36_01995 [Pyricularia pennisetigena]|uniref:hypothetical protein n=1 Tax=Pyricularia pennisetigena TaxID=1578925 RepID=UPI001152DDB7|nr:hypothetical protein PpBr36_01995 [Pyricularia pennisetigena]TLS29245.1 hypothetical protein PpBr36_01995 [Pyricularia pennisetigena]
MSRSLGRLFSRRYDQPGQTNSPMSIRESEPIMIPAVGTWSYSKPDSNISFKFLDTHLAQLDEALQENTTAVLFVANLACYDEPVPQATNHIQGVLGCFATLRSKARHLPMIFILRGTDEFKARQQESPIYRCFPDGDSTHELGDVAGMKLLMRKVDELGGAGQKDGDQAKRGELTRKGGALEMRFVAAAVKEIVVQAAGDPR